MVVEGFEQIQFRVFFDFHTQVEQLLNRCVAGHEVFRTGSEGNDLQVS